MPRAGSGGHSGGHSSGGHSSSRSSGGHHVSSSSSRAGSSRAGSSSSRSTSSFMGGGGGFRPPIIPPMPRRSYYNHTTVYNNVQNAGPGGYPPGPGGNMYDHRDHRQRSGCLNPLLTAVAVFFGFFLLLTVIGLFVSDGPTNSRNREKVNTGVAFHNNCIVDELGWFDNIPKTERRLQNFYDKTGIQPYIVLHAYDPALQTDAEKEAFANEYYEENIDNEGTFLFMYFAEEDQDNDVGYMCYVNGKQITSVMDSEAVDIFWAYVDNNWYSDASTDDMFVSIFDSTAKTIMTKSATKEDVGVKFGIVAIIIVGAVAVVVIMKLRRKHEREKAEETERILNAPINDIAAGDNDPLVSKYMDDNK